MVREVGHEETKNRSAPSLRVMPLRRRPAALQQLREDETVREPAPEAERYSLVTEPCSRNDWPASWSFHIAPPYGGSTPVLRESSSHLEGHKPRLA